MIKFLKLIIKNPFTIWLRWLLKKIFIESKNNHLFILYLAEVNDSIFGKYVTLYDYSTFSNSKIGDFSYIGKNTKVNNASIGNFCSIGPNCNIGLGKHPSRGFVSTHPIFYSTQGQSQIIIADKIYFNEYGKIEIGNDVWIGANCIIVDDVKIGDGAIIATGAVVTKDIPPYAIVGGVPAKIIKDRCTEEQKQFLLSFKWWNKDFNWIKKNYKLFHKIDLFIEKNKFNKKDK